MFGEFSRGETAFLLISDKTHYSLREKDCSRANFSHVLTFSTIIECTFVLLVILNVY